MNKSVLLKAALVTLVIAGIGVFLAPIGGVLVIFAVVAIGLSAKD